MLCSSCELASGLATGDTGRLRLECLVGVVVGILCGVHSMCLEFQIHRRNLVATRMPGSALARSTVARVVWASEIPPRIDTDVPKTLCILWMTALI